MRRPEGITIIAIWFFINTLMCGLGLLGLAIGLVGLWTGGDAGGVILGTMGMMMAEIAVAATGIAFAVVGWGLMNLKAWSRGAAIVLAALNLLAVPFGTVAGILTLVYLNRNQEAKQAFGITPS